MHLSNVHFYLIHSSRLPTSPPLFTHLPLPQSFNHSFTLFVSLSTSCSHFTGHDLPLPTLLSYGSFIKLTCLALQTTTLIGLLFLLPLTSVCLFPISIKIWSLYPRHLVGSFHSPSNSPNFFPSIPHLLLTQFVLLSSLIFRCLLIFGFVPWVSHT